MIKLEQKTLEFQGVIEYKYSLEGKNVFEEFDLVAQELKQLLMSRGIYTSGPVFYTYNPFKQSNENSIMVSLGNQITLEGELTQGFTFHKSVLIENCYMYKHYDITEEIPYTEIKEQLLNEEKKEIVNIFHVALEFYGETRTDIYFEVEGV